MHGASYCPSVQTALLFIFKNNNRVPESWESPIPPPPGAFLGAELHLSPISCGRKQRKRSKVLGDREEKHELFHFNPNIQRGLSGFPRTLTLAPEVVLPQTPAAVADVWLEAAAAFKVTDVQSEAWTASQGCVTPQLSVFGWRRPAGTEGGRCSRPV